MCRRLSEECGDSGSWREPMDDRAEFEAAAWAMYRAKREAGAFEPQSHLMGDDTPEALFWKQPDGSYGVLMFNAAWWGWQAARGLV